MAPPQQGLRSGKGTLYFLIHDRGTRAMALTAVADSGLSTGASRIGLRLALGERCSLTLRRPSREIEFVLQPVALLPKFLFFLLDEFLFMPKLFVLRRSFSFSFSSFSI